MNPLAQRKVTIYDAMQLKIISWNFHNRILATYVQYPLEDVKSRCGHAKQYRPTITNLATFLPSKVT